MYNFVVIAFSYFVTVESISVSLSGWTKTSWPTNIIKYQFSTNLPTELERDFYSAVDDYHQKTCVKFEKKLGHDQLYLNIVKGQLDPWVDNRCISPEYCSAGITGNKRTIQYYDCVSKDAWIRSLGFSLGAFVGHKRHVQLRLVSSQKTRLSHGIVQMYKNALLCLSKQIINGTDCCYCEIPPEITDASIPCGDKAYSELSVLDADAINERYGCQNCYRHRWRCGNLYKNNTGDKKGLNSFGNVDFFGREIFACRASAFSGEYAVGMHTHEGKTCIIPSMIKDQSVEVLEGFELLQIPNGLNGNEHCYSEELSYKSRRPSFQYETRSNLNLSGNALKEEVPAGSIYINEKYYEGYIAFGSISAEHYKNDFYNGNEGFVDVIGTAWNINGKLDYALFPIVIGENRKLVKLYNFQILMCKR